MLKILIRTLVLLAIVAVSLVGCVFWQVNSRLDKVYSVEPVPIEEEVMKADVELGKRIVTVRNGCVDCHGADLSGHKVMENGAMGTIYGSNITPAALKDWSEAEVARAIRHGIGKDGKALVLMPSHEYSLLSKSDLAAIIAYLKTVPPVEKESVPVKLGPVSSALIAFNQAPSFIPAEIIQHESLTFTEKPKEEASVAFGKYMIDTACRGCHGPELKGGQIPGGDPKWPPAANLTQEALKSWSEADFIKAMKEGTNPSGAQLKLPMPTNLTSQMSEMEIKAMWMYLQTL